MPTVADAHPSIALVVEGVTVPVLFHTDSGSAFTLLTAAQAALMALPLVERGKVPGAPSHLGQADGASLMPVLGGVRLRIHVPNAQCAVEVWALVVEELFCSALLGRNVLEAVDAHLGTPSVWSEGPDMRPIPTAALHGELTALATSKGRQVFAAQDVAIRTAAADQLHTSAYFWMAEAALRSGGSRVAVIQGQFFPSAQVATAMAAATVVSARVDWDTAAVKGRRRVVMPARLAVDRARADVQKNDPLGVFILGRPHTVALATPITVAQTADEALLSAIVARCVADNPLLPTAKDKTAASEAIGAFHFVEDLPEAANAMADPFVIHLEPGARPRSRRNYPMTAAEEAFAEAQIQVWLRNGTIQPSTSPWASPVVIAKHPRTGKLRFCIDYRALNALTLPDAYLLPRIEDITRAVAAAGATIFSKVDLAAGFNQVPMDPTARTFTAFRGPRHGLYEYLGGCFGLRNLPAAFQRFMDNVVGTMLWQHACVYIDDVIIFSATLEQHHRDLADLASRFRQFKVVARASKCEFYSSEVEFLGYLLSAKGLRIIPERVSAVRDVTVPTDRAELRAFMGLTGQFRHLVHNYALIAAPLEAMKHKASQTVFDISPGSPGFIAFGLLKDALLEMPTLAIPDTNLPFTAWADASEHAMSFLLAQEQKGVMQVIGFYSKAFKDEEKIWGMPRKEANCIHHFVTGTCWPYLASRGPHTLYVDSTTSAALGKQTLDSPVLLRQALALQDLPLNIVLIPGKKNAADAGTRPPFVRTDPHLAALAPLSPLRTHLGWQALAAHADAVVAAAPTPAALPVLAPITLPAWTVGLEGLPSSANIQTAQALDPDLARTIVFITAGRPSLPADATFELRAAHRLLVASAAGMVLEGGLLLRVVVTQGAPHVQVVVPASLQTAVLDAAHKGPVAHAHAGLHARLMEEAITRFAFWGHLRADTQAYQCFVCNRQGKVHTKLAGLLHTRVVRRPGETVSLDFVPMKKHKGFVGFFLALDKWSGYAAAVAVRGQTAVEALRAYDQALSPIFCDIQRVVVDMGSAFISTAFREGLAHRGVAEILPAFAGHQQANFVERAVQQLKEMLRKTLDGLPTSGWHAALANLMRTYNLTFQSSRGASPVYILSGWQPRGALPFVDNTEEATQGHVFHHRAQLQTIVDDALTRAALDQSAQYNRHRVDRRFAKGDFVLLRRQRPQVEDGAFNLSSPWEENPYIVEVALSEVSYLIRNAADEASRRTAHVCDLRLAAPDVTHADMAAGLMDVANPHRSYLVQKIHAHRFNSGDPLDRSYLVEWGGFNRVADYTWEPRSSLEDAPVDPASPSLVARYDALWALPSTTPLGPSAPPVITLARGPPLAATEADAAHTPAPSPTRDAAATASPIALSLSGRHHAREAALALLALQRAHSPLVRWLTRDVLQLVARCVWSTQRRAAWTATDAVLIAPHAEQARTTPAPVPPPPTVTGASLDAAHTQFADFHEPTLLEQRHHDALLVPGPLFASSAQADGFHHPRLPGAHPSDPPPPLPSHVDELHGSPVALQPRAEEGREHGDVQPGDFDFHDVGVELEEGAFPYPNGLEHGDVEPQDFAPAPPAPAAAPAAPAAPARRSQRKGAGTNRRRNQ